MADRLLQPDVFFVVREEEVEGREEGERKRVRERKREREKEGNIVKK